MNGQKLLALVEFMVSVNEDPTGDAAKKIVADIYRFVHSNCQAHSCYHVHKDWRVEAANCFKSIPKDFI